jgi:putative iron-only hydrogenase system regulator
MGGKKRIGSIAVIIEDNRKSVAEVNRIFSEYFECITARTGIPNHDKGIYVISLIVELTTEQLGAVTGRLGNLPGVTVKSLLTDKSY